LKTFDLTHPEDAPLLALVSRFLIDSPTNALPIGLVARVAEQCCIQLHMDPADVVQQSPQAMKQWVLMCNDVIKREWDVAQLQAVPAVSDQWNVDEASDKVDAVRSIVRRRSGGSPAPILKMEFIDITLPVNERMRNLARLFVTVEHPTKVSVKLLSTAMGACHSSLQMLPGVKDFAREEVLKWAAACNENIPRMWDLAVLADLPPLEAGDQFGIMTLVQQVKSLKNFIGYINCFTLGKKVLLQKLILQFLKISLYLLKIMK
jgi:hypothetical protein